MTTATLDPPQASAAHRRRQAVVTAREVTITAEDGYAGLLAVIPLYAELLATYEHPDPAVPLLEHLTWLIETACSPWARLWAFYDGETMIGLLFVELQQVYGSKRVFVYGYYLRKGYRVGTAGRHVEAEVEAWGHRHGARYLEFQTQRSPQAWRPRGYAVQGYVMRKSLSEGVCNGR